MSLLSALMQHEELSVPVNGGDLRVCRWPGSGPAVIAVHGITANAMSFGPLAQRLDGRVQLIAPDLRGRAGSAGLPGPYGLATHVADLIAVMDHLALPTATLVGHSMGGFVAALAAANPRIAAVLLVDGGVSFGAAPPGADIDAILEAVIGPAIRRLQMTFDSRESYLDFWRAHPSLKDSWSPFVEAYALRDLNGDRSSCNLEAIREDGRDTLVNEETTTAFRKIPCPVRLLWAERGMLNEPAGLYSAVALPDYAAEVKDVNHYTIVLSDTGTAAIDEHLRALAGAE